MNDTVRIPGLESAASVAPTPMDKAPVPLRRILVALDASEHANRALHEAVRLAAGAGGAVTGIHVYAAKLHDRRFRQMEGGLPERYREERELERQRDVHDELITRGLGLIADGYHDAAEAACGEAAVPYRRLSPEGKNYRRIVEATASGEFDLLAIGALGLGAVPGSLIGSVCERVVRRCSVDLLVIRDPARALGDGPLVVAIDGSARSFGALMTGLAVGRRFGVPVHAVAAYDPHFHAVAFQRIAGVLSEEAGRVFRFREQQRLHEEIIDDGLAKIYRSHLRVAAAIAEHEGLELRCDLLEGKPFRVIARHAEKVDASLLLLGKTGIHADSGLDIGGTAENLVRAAPCQVWLGMTTFTPPADALAEETMSWTKEAEERLRRVPEMMRGMVRLAVLRYAQDRGHTVVTSGLLDEATQKLCPHRAGAAQGGEKPPELRWEAAALARLARIPESAGRLARDRAEVETRKAGAAVVTLDILEAVLARSPEPTHGATAPEATRGNGHPGDAGNG